MSAGALVPADFIPASAPPPLPPGEIHLWFFPQWERARDAADSAPLRRLLAAYLDRPVETIRIERGAHGKPRIADAQLQFNLSHAADALLLGISRNSVLGVDIEPAARTVSAPLELAQRFFALREAAALAALPEPARQAAFLRLWCAKEAVLKAHGQGIGFGLERFEFVVDSAGMSIPATGNPWRICEVIPALALVGALAYREPVSHLRAFVANS